MCYGHPLAWFLSWWVGGKDDRVPCSKRSMFLKIAVEVKLAGWSRRQLRLAQQSALNQWRHLSKWHLNCVWRGYCLQRVHSEQVLRRLVFKDPTTSFFISMKSELTVCVKSSYSCFRYRSPLLLRFNLYISSSATSAFCTNRLRVFQQRVSFLQVRVVIKIFDAFLQCLKTLSFSRTFSCFRNFQE